MEYVSVIEMGAALVVTPQKNLTGGPESEALGRILSELADDGRDVVVDLHKVEQMNLCGCEPMSECWKHRFHRNGHMKVCRVCESRLSPAMVLHIVREFDVYATLEDAVAGGTIGAGRPEG